MTKMSEREKALFALLIGEKYGKLLSCAECGERYVLTNPVDRREYEDLVQFNKDVETFKYCQFHAFQRGGGAAPRRTLSELLKEA